MPRRDSTRKLLERTRGQRKRRGQKKQSRLDRRSTTNQTES